MAKSKKRTSKRSSKVRVKGFRCPNKSRRQVVTVRCVDRNGHTKTTASLRKPKNPWVRKSRKVRRRHSAPARHSKSKKSKRRSSKGKRSKSKKSKRRSSKSKRRRSSKSKRRRSSKHGKKPTRKSRRKTKKPARYGH